MPDDEGLDESIVIELRPPDVVAMRCIILATIMRRFGIATSPDADSIGAAFDFREWLRAEGLWDQTAAREKALFLRPPAGTAFESVGEIAMIAESLTTVAWALGLLPTLADADVADLGTVMPDIPGPWDKTAPWIAARSLRSEIDIVVVREFNEIWYWRFSVEPFRRLASGRELMEIERTIRDVTRDGISVGLLKPGKKGGFTAEGVPLAIMDPEEIDELTALAQERLIALNWICGFGEDWDNVPLDV